MKPDPRNARSHSEVNLRAIKNSLSRYGQRKPIIVNKNSGFIEAGSGLWTAAKSLDWDMIAVVSVDDSHEMATAYGLMDNKSALLADWDLPTLKDLLEELDTGEFDLEELTAFSGSEVEQLMSQYHVPREGLTDDDTVPEATESISRRGDLWVLGNHRLLCGDATVITDVERLMGGEKADMVFTDPPYGVSYDTDTRPSGKPIRSLGAVKNDDLGDKEFDELLRGSLVNIYSSISMNASYYVCFGAKKFHFLIPVLLDLGFHIGNRIIWSKNQFILGRSDYHTQWEFLIYGWKEGQKHNWYGGRDQSDVWEEKQETHGTYLHPTMKPVALITKAINNNTVLNQSVIDLFGGSGSTLIACEKLDRRCFMMEIDEHYCDVIIKRWEDYTGKKAVKSDGRATP